jgi:hypothetical protein
VVPEVYGTGEVSMNTFAKIDFPVSDIRRFLEPSPIVLISSARKGRTKHHDDGLAHADGIPAVALRVRTRGLRGAAPTSIATPVSRQFDPHRRTAELHFLADGVLYVESDESLLPGRELSWTPCGRRTGPV